MSDETLRDLPAAGERPQATEAEPRPEPAQPGHAAQEPGPQPQASAVVYCARCGAVMNPADRFCHRCGWQAGRRDTIPAPPPVVLNPSPHNRLTALLLCIFLGFFGAHRFYTGKTGTGLLWLFTLGLFGIGVVYDLVFIATGEYRDAQERRVVRWE
jgi:hypothetical protein